MARYSCWGMVDTDRRHKSGSKGQARKTRVALEVPSNYSARFVVITLWGLRTRHTKMAACKMVAWLSSRGATCLCCKGAAKATRQETRDSTEPEFNNGAANHINTGLVLLLLFSYHNTIIFRHRSNSTAGTRPLRSQSGLM